MSDALRRAVRTYLQAFVGTLATLAIPALTDLVRAIGNAEPYEIDFAFWQGVGIAAVLSGVIALVTALHNALEDKAGVPAVLKGTATSGQNPVPEPDAAPAFDPDNPGDPSQWGSIPPRRVGQ